MLELGTRVSLSYTKALGDAKLNHFVFLRLLVYRNNYSTPFRNPRSTRSSNNLNIDISDERKHTWNYLAERPLSL